MPCLQKWRTQGFARTQALDKGIDTSGCWYALTLKLVVNISPYLQEYPFAKYNVQLTTYTYSQDDYTRFLEGALIQWGAFKSSPNEWQTRTGRRKRRIIYSVWFRNMMHDGISSMIGIRTHGLGSLSLENSRQVRVSPKATLNPELNVPTIRI